MTINIILAVLRSVLYLWIAIEFSNLAYLYWEGYRNIKTTPIIRALQIMFVFLSIRSLLYAFLPVLLELGGNVHYIIVSYVVPIFLIPLGWAIRKFRSESLNKQTMKLPDKKDKKNE